MDEDKERKVHSRPDPGMKVSLAQWEEIKTLVCAGASATELAEKFDIKPNTIHRKASQEKWATPARIVKAQSKGLPASDPASQVAEIWSARQGKAREQIFQGSKKALERFFASSPVPQSFSEAKLAADMMNKAIDPTEGQGKQEDLNLQLLTASGSGILIEAEEITEPDSSIENEFSQSKDEEEKSIQSPNNTPIDTNTPTTDNQ